jgi:hypothetical protein
MKEKREKDRYNITSYDTSLYLLKPFYSYVIITLYVRQNFLT